MKSSKAVIIIHPLRTEPDLALALFSRSQREPEPQMSGQNIPINAPMVKIETMISSQ
jgi:hypothetical protein